MMTDHQTALFSLLLGSFPTFQSGDGEAALAAYELVIRQADQRDIEPGVMLLINGEYPGHDGRFAPTAPQLATAIRMARDKRLESERLARIKNPPPLLASPDIEKTPEQRERAKAQVQAFVEGVAAADVHVTTEETRRRRERWAKVNARFDPPQDDASIMERLLGYSVGSPESEETAA